jgi:hypothetical protein
MKAPARLASFCFIPGRNSCGNLARGGSFPLRETLPMFPRLLGDPFARLTKFSPRTVKE